MLINSPNISGSLTVTGNSVISGSLTVAGTITGTIAGTTATASYVEYNNVANKPALVSGSSQITYSGLSGIPSGIVSGSAQISGFGIFATTGSNQFNGNQAITGSLTTTGTIVAQTLNVQQVTSSIVFSSGSNIFGNSVSNTQQFTGSLQVSGSSHYLLGSVGVGVTSPVAELQVGKASDVTIAMSNSNSITSGVRGNITWYNSSNSTVANIRATAVTDNVGTQLEFYTRPAAGSLTQRLTLDSSGNLGLGVTPSAWGSQAKAMQLGTGAAISGIGSDTHVSNGIFYDGANWKYLYSGSGVSTYYQTVGAHIWFNAPSGAAAGNNVSLSQAMTLNASGRLLLGTTDDNGARLQVSGGNITATNNLVFNRPSTSAGNNIEWRTASTLNWYIGTRGLVDNNFYFVNEALGVNNLILNASTGAATFSSTVTTGGTIVASLDQGSNNQFFNLTGTQSGFAQTYSLGIVGSSRDFRIFDITANQQRLTITSGGNVGIGTTSPSTLLHVNGTSTQLTLQNADGGTNAERIGMFMTGGDIFKILSLNDNNTTRVDNIITANVLSGNVGIGTASPVQRLDVNGKIRLTDDLQLISTNPTIVWGSGTLRFYDNANAAVRMTLDASGNLGLGVTPSAWGSYTAYQVGQGAISNNNGGNVVNIHSNNYYDGSSFRYISNGEASMYQQAGGAHGWRIAPSGTAGNAITFTQAMTLNASGNLSIGNTNDTFRLDVSGAGRFSGIVGSPVTLTISSGNSNCDITMQSANSSSVSRIRNGTNDLQLHTNGNLALTLASNQAATFTSSVTANSSAFLGQVPTYGSDFAQFSHSSRAGADQYSFLSGIGGDTYINCVNAQPIRFRHNNSNLAMITSDGNLIINPVGGYNASLLTIKAANADGKQIHIVQSNDDRGWRFSARTDGHFYLAATYNGSDSNILTARYDTGNVGIGTASPFAKLEVLGGNNLPPSTGTQNYTIALRDPTSMIANVGGSILFQGFKTSTSAIGNFAYIAGKKENGTAGNEAGYLSIGTFDSSGIPAEQMRITSGGFLKASNNGAYLNATQNYHEFRSNRSDENLAIFQNTSASPYGPWIYFQFASPNNTGNYFLAGSDSTNDKFIIYSNGNMVNRNGSYGAISDAKLKENIEDATPKLDDLMKVKIRNYNLIGDDKKQIGVIAQELEEVFPAMIDESPDYEEVEVPQVDEEGNEILNEEGEIVTTKERVSKGTTTKSVKYSVFVPMLIKAMQEQQSQIEILKAEIQLLKQQ